MFIKGANKQIDTMSELIKKRLIESVGKNVLIFLHNNFRYEGKITGCDETYVEILEPRGYKILDINEIKEIEVKK